MRAGLFVAYWPWFSPEEQVSPAVSADEAAGVSTLVCGPCGPDPPAIVRALAAATA